MKKWILIVLLVVVGGAAAFVAYDRLTGGRRIEDWVGRLVVGVANSYLIPQISYETIAYTAPGRVDLGGVAFTAPDGTRVIEIEGFSLELAQIPSYGKPIVVERVIIRDGTINLVQDPETGEIRGLVPIAEPNPTDEYRVEGEAEPFRLSDTLRLREIVLERIDIRYDDGSGRVLELDDIELRSTIQPEALEGEPGWYALDVTMDRGEALRVSVPGHVNLDTLVARVDQGQVTAEVSEETIRSLPSALQALLSEYQASGSLRVGFDGYIPLTDPVSGLFTADVELASFNVSHGEFRVPVTRLVVEAGLSGGAVELSSLEADALNGTIEASASMPAKDPSGMGSAEWTVEGVDLSALMSAQASEDPSRLAGILSSTGSVRVSPAGFPATIEGAGEAHVRDGRLLMMPGISALASAMNVATRGSTKSNHRADAEFRFAPEGIRVEKSEVVTEFLAARGTGLIDYAGHLDMNINAGPLERLQAALGQVGNIFGKITDQVMTYHMYGPIGEPKVAVSGPAGIGRPDTARKESPEETPAEEPEKKGGGDGAAEESAGSGGGG